MIWAEAEGEEADYLMSLLEERFELHGRSPAFADQPLDDHVRDLCESLALPPGCGNDWRHLPDPDWTCKPAPEPELRSSA